jgi:hypothetical protein
MATAADTYGVVVPAGWTQIPLDQEGYTRFSRELLDGLKHTDGWSRTGQRRLELLLTQVRNDLRSGRVRLAAITASTEDGSGGEPSLLLAGMAISRLGAADLSSSGLHLEVEPLLAAMSRQRFDDAADQVVEVEPPTQVNINGWPAVRLKRLHDTRIPSGHRARLYAQTYLVPHDDGEAACVLQFSTPNVEEGSALDELFQAIAETLRIFHPGEDTTFDPREGDGRG